MPSYKAPVEEVLFLLRDVFPIQRYNNLPGFAEATPDVVEAILAEAAKLCEQTLQPLNQTGDQEGCVRNKDGSVATPQGFKEAYRAFVEGGWVGLAADPRLRRPGAPLHARRDRQRVREFREHGVRHVSGLKPRRACRPDDTWHGGAEKDVRAKTDQRRLVGHDEPHRVRIAAPISASSKPRPSRMATVPTRFLAKKSSSRPVSTISRKISFISCLPGSRERPPASRAFRCLWCPKS